MQIELDRTWRLGEKIGSGGFGSVYAAEAEGMPACVAKLVPKDRGAARELLFVDLSGVRNVVPIIESGGTDSHWVLIMPRADRSLREALDAGALHVDDAIAVVRDIATALTDLDGKVVHRDIKPENTLWLDGHWCLADFGISRYAEATTAPDTQKYAFSPPYAAPERWRMQRATAATDVYSLGVMTYELLVGKLPFGGTLEDLQEAHLSREPEQLEGVATNLAALVHECLYKAPGARPSAANLLARLERQAATPSPGLARLQTANLQQVMSQSKAEREASAQQSELESRQELQRAAHQAFEAISTKLYQAVLDSAPAAQVQDRDSWSIRLGNATLSMADITDTPADPWSWDRPAFEVVAHSFVSINIPRHRDYEGRVHSLWYCDAQEAAKFQWFECAFMITPGMPRRGIQNPFGLAPGEESAKAVWNGMAEFQMAWPFQPLNADTLPEFIDRWATWFADAVEGKLQHPSTMPERHAEGSWRKK